MPDGSLLPACKATLKKEKGVWFRVITSIQLSRPEDYLSIYQSGCNHSCLKCHSWYFSQKFNGEWVSSEELAVLAADYLEKVTVFEPRERATMWHATDLCRHCGSCKLYGERGPLCPMKLPPDKIVLSAQGFGPARNIVAFTGGDIACVADYYVDTAELIKEHTGKKLWMLLETNGYGLIEQNLETMQGAIDSFWLDIKAYNEETYRKLCGTTNKWILEVPQLAHDMGFTLEILTLFIPGIVETDQIVKIAELVKNVDPKIPFTLLAFFPEYKLKHVRPPTLYEMVKTYYAIKEVGLENIKLGNCHIFAKTEEEWRKLLLLVDVEAIG